MSGSPYAATLGRLIGYLPTFLTKEAVLALAGAKDLAEITKILEANGYGPEIAESASTASGATLLEIAVNRAFVRRNRMALEASPFAGRPILAAYLRRWDVQNVALVLSAKAHGRPLRETESFLVTDRQAPAGLLAGSMTLDDLRGLLEQPTVEAVVAALVRYGFGSSLLPLLDAYQRDHDLFPLLTALDREYYDNLRASLVYFQGDEWVVRELIASEIDVRNLLTILKGRDAGLPLDAVERRFLDGGTVSRAELPDLYGARGVPELVASLAARFPALGEGLTAYQAERSLSGFEFALHRARSVREYQRLRSYPMSAGIMFLFLVRNELERNDLRRVIYGKMYGVASEQLAAEMITPLLA